MFWDLEHQNIVHLAVLVEQMKAIVNHMTNVFLVLFVCLKDVLSVLAFPMQQAVVMM